MGNYGSSESSLGSKESHTLPLGGEGGTSSPLTVMKHHSGTLGDVGGRQDFCSTKAGCGLVELSRYGVKPNALTDAGTLISSSAVVTNVCDEFPAISSPTPKFIYFSLIFLHSC